MRCRTDAAGQIAGTQLFQGRLFVRLDAATARVENLHWLACDTHAPLFWESEPPPTFAHMPLPKSSKATLNPSICLIPKLRVGLTIPIYPKCSRYLVRIETRFVGRIGAA